jgi:uncharacterized protein YPO0396
VSAMDVVQDARDRLRAAVRELDAAEEAAVLPRGAIRILNAQQAVDEAAQDLANAVDALPADEEDDDEDTAMTGQGWSDAYGAPG